jgi:hypothetical protein
MYDSKIEDFGCIQHPVYKFLGASPDGIVIKSESGRYGRMIEIKNPVSREITGIPKKEYWVQMQLQMEVCDLDECDFLETKFAEYSDYTSYNEDTSVEFKGSIIYFHTKEGAPFYAYQPLNVKSKEELELWEEETLEKYQSEPYNHVFIKFIYWKLEKMSCIQVLRNKEWFKNNVGQLEKVWKIEAISFYNNIMNLFIDYTKTKANNYNWKMVYIVSKNYMDSFVQEQIRMLTFKKKDKKVA